MAIKDETQSAQTSTAEPKIKQKQGKTKKEETPDQLIYVGPNLKKNGMAIRSNQVFLGGYPEHLSALYTAYPLLKQLFVPIDQFQVSKQQLKQTGSALHIALRSLEVE